VKATYGSSTAANGSSASKTMEGQPNPPQNNTAHEAESNEGDLDKKSPHSPSDSHPDPSDKKVGRRKIQIEFIEDKSRRHITFSKRKAGIMKKAYELSTLTGTQVLLLVASETGHVYTFATPKLQPLITKSEGKNLIQACLNAPDNSTSSSGGGASSRMSASQSQPEPNMNNYGDPGLAEQYEEEKAPHGSKADAKAFAPLGVAAQQMTPQFASPPYVGAGDYGAAAGLGGYPGMMQRPGGSVGYPMQPGYGPGAGPAPTGYPPQGYPYMGWPKPGTPGAMGMPLSQGGHSQPQGGQGMGQHGKQ